MYVRRTLYACMG